MKDITLLNRIYPNKNDQAKRVILKHAIHCFSENGIESTTVDSIRERSKVSIGTIYYHFNSKEAILAHLVFAAMDDLFNLRQQYLMQATNFKECVYAFVLAYTDWVVAHPNFAKILYNAEFDVHNSCYRQQLEERKIDNRNKVISWISLPEYQHDQINIPTCILSSIINGPVEHYCKYWLLNRVSESPLNYREELAYSTWMAIKSYQFIK